MVIKQAPFRRTGFGLPDAEEETYGSLFGYAPHYIGLGNLLGAARWINYTFSINRSERWRCSPLTCFFLLFAELLASNNVPNPACMQMFLLLFRRFARGLM